MLKPKVIVTPQKQNDIQDPKFACSICGKKTNMCCSQCSQAFYCTIEHQRSHWKSHKSECNTKLNIEPSPKLEIKVPARPRKEEPIQSENFQITPTLASESNQFLMKQINLDKDINLLQKERAQLRKQVITQFATGEYEKSIIVCKKLIQKSRSIFDLTKKRPDFYDYIADELTLVKAYLKIDQVKSAREILTEDAFEMEEFIQSAKIIPIAASAASNKDAYDLSMREKEDIKSRNENMNDIRKRCSLLALMASLFYACGDFKNCEKHYVLYVQVIESGFGQESLETSNCYFLVGVFYLQHKYFIKSLACFKRSLSIRLSKLGERHESISDCWYNLSIIYKQTGKKIKAIEFLERTLQLRRELIGDVSLQVAQTLETLGKIYMEEADFKSALIKFEECYKIRRRIINNDQHSDIIRISLLIIHLYTLVREQVLQQTAPKKSQDMLQGLSDHISTSLLDKNLNHYLQMAKSHLDVLLLEEKKKEHERAIGMYDKKQLQNQTLENNVRQLQSDHFNHHNDIEELSIDGYNRTYRENEQQLEDDPDDPQHHLIVEKDLMSTLSLDQLLALQQLYDLLKEKNKKDPAYEALTDVIRSEFVRSLSHVQFAILKQSNGQLFMEDNQEIHQFEISRGQSAQVLVNIAASMDAPYIAQSSLLHAHLLQKQQGMNQQEIAQHQQLSAFITPQTHPHIMGYDANHPLQTSIRPTGSTVYGSPSVLYHPQQYPLQMQNQYDQENRQQYYHNQAHQPNGHQQDQYQQRYYAGEHHDQSNDAKINKDQFNQRPDLFRQQSQGQQNYGNEQNHPQGNPGANKQMQQQQSTNMSFNDHNIDNQGAMGKSGGRIEVKPGISNSSTNSNTNLSGNQGPKGNQMNPNGHDQGNPNNNQGNPNSNSKGDLNNQGNPNISQGNHNTNQGNPNNNNQGSQNINLGNPNNNQGPNSGLSHSNSNQGNSNSNQGIPNSNQVNLNNNTNQSNPNNNQGNNNPGNPNNNQGNPNHSQGNLNNNQGNKNPGNPNNNQGNPNHSQGNLNDNQGNNNLGNPNNNQGNPNNNQGNPNSNQGNPNSNQGNPNDNQGNPNNNQGNNNPRNSNNNQGNSNNNQVNPNNNQGNNNPGNSNNNQGNSNNNSSTNQSNPNNFNNNQGNQNNNMSNSNSKQLNPQGNQINQQPNNQAPNKPNDSKLVPNSMPITPSETSLSNASSNNAPIPPPIIQRGSMPPPPPRLSDVPPAKVDLGPKSRTKQLFWDKTLVDPLTTIWGEQMNQKKVELDDLDDLFSNAPAKTNSTSYQAVKVDHITLLLDAKKLANINIMLSKFKKYSNDEMKVKFIHLDDQLLNTESAQTLIQYIPEAEELNNCKEFAGNIDQLDGPSKFFLMISQVPNYEARLRNTIFKDDLATKIKIINSQCSLIMKSSDILRRSQSFKSFLKLVLDVGNKMNSGTLKGKAQGFKLSSLNQLTQMKSSKGDITLLQYIIKKLITENQTEVLRFSDEFDCFKDTQILNINDTMTNLQILQGQLHKLQVVLDSAKQSGDVEFVQAFTIFNREATQQINESQKNVQNAKNEWESTARFFGEDDEYFKTKTSEDFFRSLFIFNDAVKKAEKSTQLQNKFGAQQNNNTNRFK